MQKNDLLAHSLEDVEGVHKVLATGRSDDPKVVAKLDVVEINTRKKVSFRPTVLRVVGCQCKPYRKSGFYQYNYCRWRRRGIQKTVGRRFE